ncbi:MAG: DUF3857 domain-containing protein [Bacteroidota bacterium]
MPQKFKKLILAAISVMMCHSAIAQETIYRPKEFNFGKIDPEEFKIKPSGVDSAAAAVAIFDIGIGFFDLGPSGMKYNIQRHTRYKIINKNGYDYANLEIQLYKSSNGGSNLTNVEACTYNIENGKVIASKIGKDAKFTEKQDKNYSVKKFVLPNVKEGSIIEFKYTMSTDFVFNLRPWYFQRSIPTLHSAYVVSIPEYYNYKINQYGLIHLTSKSEQVNGGTVYSYAVNNVPGLKEESYVADMNDYISRVTFELASMSFPGQEYRDFTSTWPKIIHTIKEREDFGQFIKKTAGVKSILAEIIKEETNKDSIVCRILNFVKQNIKWNRDYDLFANETNAKSVFEKKLGNSADINLSLLVLLSAANIEANPVLLSTRDNGTHPGRPMITAFNNVIVDAKIGEKHILLDATDKHHAPNLIGYNNLNHEGLVLNMDSENAKWISLENSKASGISYNYILTLGDDNKLTGKLYITSTDYEALRRRKDYSAATDEKEFLKLFKGDKPGLALKNYEILNLNSPDASLTESMDVLIEDQIEEGGDMFYFTPLLYERTKENPFKLEERNFPVDFGFPMEETYRITIELPKGYVVDVSKFPKNEKLVLPNQTASFSFIFSHGENQIGLISRISVKKSLFTPDEYFELKELFKNIVRKQAEQIVVKKI